MFWIYGGGYTSGANLDPTFDAGNIVSKGDVVLFAINYRLAAFGFLALNDGITNGNYGIGDTINALDWFGKIFRTSVVILTVLPFWGRALELQVSGHCLRHQKRRESSRPQFQ
jgi:hypothetical protein